MLSFDAVEEICESKSISLVIHPAIRRALRGYEESFCLGLRCFLSGDAHNYFLPLQDGGYVRLAFSMRTSSGGYNLLKIEPLKKDGLSRIKRSLETREMGG